MENNSHKTLEQALASTEADAAATLKAADALTKSLRKFHAAAKTGDLRELRSSVDAAEKAMAGLRQQFANARDNWSFDEESYLGNGLFTREVIDVGQQLGVRIFERDERLYCYPALIRVSPRDKAVFIDKKRQGRIRPSVLAAHLRELQRRPPRFRPEAFLDALYESYSKAAAMRRDQLSTALVVPLLDIYELLTLLPGQSREYSRQEFARDIYLLDRSGVDTTKKGYKISFPSSTGTRSLSRTISVITESGDEKRYYGICFTQISREQ